MDTSTRELLGLGKDDHWGYLAFAFVLASFFVTNTAVVALLTLLGALFLVAYLVRSTRRILRTSEFSNLVTRVGLVVNLIGVLGFCWLVFERSKRPLS